LRQVVFSFPINDLRFAMAIENTPYFELLSCLADELFSNCKKAQKRIISSSI
jgi:hypothetical protein